MILYFPASRTMRNKFPCLSYPVYGIFYISPSRLIQWKWNYTEQKCKTCEWLWNHSNSKVWNIASEKDWSALKKPKKLWECCRWEFTKEQNLPENWGKGDPCYNRNRNYNNTITFFSYSLTFKCSEDRNKRSLNKSELFNQLFVPGTWHMDNNNNNHNQS